jgi:hypothetical protein
MWEWDSCRSWMSEDIGIRWLASQSEPGLCGAIHRERQERALVSALGSVDASLVRAVLECLRQWLGCLDRNAKWVTALESSPPATNSFNELRAPDSSGRSRSNENCDHLVD